MKFYTLLFSLLIIQNSQFFAMNENVDAQEESAVTIELINDFESVCCGGFGIFSVQIEDAFIKLNPGESVVIPMESEGFKIFKPFTNLCATSLLYEFHITCKPNEKLRNKSFQVKVTSLLSCHEGKSTIELDENTKLIIDCTMMDITAS